MLWIFYRMVIQRIETIWLGDMKDSKNDEKVWGKFNIRWCSLVKIGK
jgi:hypothetical protein